MWKRPILTEAPRCRILLPVASVYSLQRSAQFMRLSLSRLTALVVIGVALAAIPGVVSRVGGREGAARMTTRGGFPRLASAAAALTGPDDHEPDSAVAGDVIYTASRQQRSTDQEHGHAPPGRLVASAAVPPPLTDSVLLDASSLASFHPATLAPRPRGRAPPAL